MFLIVAYFISLFLIILISSVYMFFMLGKHKTRSKEEKKMIERDISFQMETCIFTLSERKYDYIRNYLIFQLGNKIFGLASVVFSILGIMTFSEKESSWIEYLIAFSSVVCVILALYISPPSRVTQYILAWKKCDALMLEVMRDIGKYEELYKKTKEDSSNEEYEKHAKDKLSELEDRITSEIVQIENSLTTDGE